MQDSDNSVVRDLMHPNQPAILSSYRASKRKQSRNASLAPLNLKGPREEFVYSNSESESEAKPMLRVRKHSCLTGVPEFPRSPHSPLATNFELETLFADCMGIDCQIEQNYLELKVLTEKLEHMQERQCQLIEEKIHQLHEAAPIKDSMKTIIPLRQKLKKLQEEKLKSIEAKILHFQEEDGGLSPRHIMILREFENTQQFFIRKLIDNIQELIKAMKFTHTDLDTELEHTASEMWGLRSSSENGAALMQSLEILAQQKRYVEKLEKQIQELKVEELPISFQERGVRRLRQIKKSIDGTAFPTH